MIQDTINSIRVTLSERIGNPFVSATLIASIILNWKLTLLLASNVPYDGKIEKIVSLYPNKSAILDSFLIHPIYFGIFWTFIWPVINIGINAYWHLMKSLISNVKVWAERKKVLSEAEAAAIYSTIDSQESKYLEFLKDRQNKIDTLSNQLSAVSKERSELSIALDEMRSSSEKIAKNLADITSNSESLRQNLERVQRDSESRQRRLENIESKSVDFAKYIPGVKEISIAINRSTNYQANEAWVKTELKRLQPGWDDIERQRMFDFAMTLDAL